MSLQPHCLSYLRNAPDGLVLEFGVSSGRSIRILAEAGRVVYGFDSFKGLPHDWGWSDPRGLFAAEVPEVPDNVVLVPGLFSDTLESFLYLNPGPVAFVHIDSDLYTSCMYVLDCLRDRWIDRSVIVFDEINQWVTGSEYRLPDERRAWNRHNAGWRFCEAEHATGEIWMRDGSAARK
jgi:hypothetical protein